MQGQFAHYAFERQPQRFPDVVLRSEAPDAPSGPILMGIELKGWYALAKEGEPTVRYTVSPAGCADLDLLVVFPWALASVVSGSPFLFPPYVQSARYAAEYRNYHWQHLMASTASKAITLATATGTYPEKSDLISDVPEYDAGGNFGRFARTGLMDDFTTDIRRRLLVGIPLDAWRRFLRVFTESHTTRAIDNLITTLERERRSDPNAILKTKDQVARFRRLLEEMNDLVGQT